MLVQRRDVLEIECDSDGSIQNILVLEAGVCSLKDILEIRKKMSNFYKEEEIIQILY